MERFTFLVSCEVCWNHKKTFDKGSISQLQIDMDRIAKTMAELQGLTEEKLESMNEQSKQNKMLIWQLKLKEDELDELIKIKFWVFNFRHKFSPRKFH